MQKGNNSTEIYSSEPLEPAFVYPVAACHIIIVIVAICGNVMVCFAIMANRNLRNNPTNSFVFSLAFSDLITVSFAVPFDIDGLLKNWVWTYGELLCQTWITVYLITVPTSILTLLAVSVDRYKSISDPLNRFRRSRFMTHTRALVVITIIWLYSIVFALVPIMGWRTEDQFIRHNYCLFPFPDAYIVMSSVVNFILPLLITCGIYIKIYHIVIQQAGRWRQQQSCEESTTYSKDIQAAKTISMFVCAIFLCWVPYSAVSIVGTLCRTCIKIDDEVSSKFHLLLLMFGYLNSALNPFLFAIRNRSFKETYSKLLNSLKLRSVASSPAHTQRRSTLTQNTFASEFQPDHHLGSDLGLHSMKSSPRESLTGTQTSSL